MDVNPITLILGLGLSVAGLMLIKKFKPTLIRLEPHEALVRTRAVDIPGSPKGVEVFFDSAHVLPAFDAWSKVDLSAKAIGVVRTGRDGIHCRDNLRADMDATFKLHITKTTDAVLQVASEVGCHRLGEMDVLLSLFAARFGAALKTVAKRYDFEELYNKRDVFQREVAESIGTDLSGYTLDGVYLDSLEQTPIEMLDPDNILDAEAITKITDRTATQHVETNRLRRAAEKTVAIEDHEHIKRQDQENFKQREQQTLASR